MQNPTSDNQQEEWLKVLGKGMITIPKSWREELGLEEGEVVKAKKIGNKVVIESQKAAPYRIFTDKEIKEWLKEDQLPKDLSAKIDKKIKAIKSA